MNLAEASYGSNEGRLQFPTETAHFGYGYDQSIGHILAGHVAGGKNKLADSMPSKSLFFEEVVADSLVRREQGPIVETDKGKPSSVWDATSEMIEVALKADAQAAKALED